MSLPDSGESRPWGEHSVHSCTYTGSLTHGQKATMMAPLGLCL